MGHALWACRDAVVCVCGLSLPSCVCVCVCVAVAVGAASVWQVVHRIDASSPLWHIRNQLEQHLKALDVSISAYDPAFHQPVKLYTRCVRCGWGG